MSNKPTMRSPAMDIIRCFALFFVISVHFFLKNGFYQEIQLGKTMYVMTLMRSFFMICVPLFMVLSGYLLSKKTVSKSYYLKLFPTLATYIMASICCKLYQVFVLKQEFAMDLFIKDLVNYDAAPYAWYVEMYMGLFLLIPFLNVLYHALDSKKKKQGLILTLIIITALPPILNIFIPELEWFMEPSSSKAYYYLLPDWWKNIYPLTYYFIGCYLKEFKINIKSRYLFLMNIAMFLINGSFNFYRSYNAKFIWGSWQNYGSLLILVQVVLFFLFFLNLNYDKFPRFGAKVLSIISGACFGGYLVSWIFDSHFYPILNEQVPLMPRKLLCYFIIVPLIYCLSILLSLVLNRIYDLLAKAVVGLISRFKKPTTNS